MSITGGRVAVRFATWRTESEELTAFFRYIRTNPDPGNPIGVDFL